MLLLSLLVLSVVMMPWFDQRDRRRDQYSTPITKLHTQQRQFHHSNRRRTSADQYIIRKLFHIGPQNPPTKSSESWTQTPAWVKNKTTSQFTAPVGKPGGPGGRYAVSMFAIDSDVNLLHQRRPSTSRPDVTAVVPCCCSWMHAQRAPPALENAAATPEHKAIY